MELSRRELISRVGMSTIMATTGCLESIPEDGVELTAEPVSIPENKLTKGGYVEIGKDVATLDSDLSIFGSSKQISVKAHGVAYAKQRSGEEEIEIENGKNNTTNSTSTNGFRGDIKPTNPVIIILSLPSPKKIRRELNTTELNESVNKTTPGNSTAPDVENLKQDIDKDLINGSFSKVSTGSIDSLENTGDKKQLSISGSEVSISVLEGTISPTEEATTPKTKVYVYTGNIKRNDDLVIPIGIHPVTEDERQNQFDLIEQIE